MPRLSRKGRIRLAILLSGMGGGLCAATFSLILTFYGAPYDPAWWGVMAMILVASHCNPILTVPMIEWVIKGYLNDDPT